MSGEAITHDGRDFTPDGACERPEVCDCGHAPKPCGISAGYVRTPEDGRTICVDCANAAEVEAFERPTTTLKGAYLSSDGKTLDTWGGIALARVTSHRARRMYGFAPHERIYFRAIDAQRRHWYGSSLGFGMYARMRRAKEG